MIEILGFIFTNFWTFIGTVILLAALGDFVHDFISAFIPKIDQSRHIHVDGSDFDAEKIKEYIEHLEKKDDQIS